MIMGDRLHEMHEAKKFPPGRRRSVFVSHESRLGRGRSC